MLEYYLFREANSFPRAKLEENCELRGTDNVQGQISKHILAPNGAYRVWYPSNLFRNARSFESSGIYKHSLHLARKYAQLEENCELRGTDNVQGQISSHIFTPNVGYRVYYPSNLFRNARNFETWGIFSRDYCLYNP